MRLENLPMMPEKVYLIQIISVSYNNSPSVIEMPDEYIRGQDKVKY